MSEKLFLALFGLLMKRGDVWRATHLYNLFVRLNAKDTPS